MCRCEGIIPHFYCGIFLAPFSEITGVACSLRQAALGESPE